MKRHHYECIIQTDSCFLCLGHDLKGDYIICQYKEKQRKLYIDEFEQVVCSKLEEKEWENT